MNNVDSIRLEQFRQIRKEIRGASEYLIVGIDVAKEKNYAFYGTATGKTLLKRMIFENSIEGFEKLRIHEDALKVRHGLKKVIYGLEPTANYHKPLGEYLIKCCRNVVLVSGLAVKNNRKMMNCRWDKNDTKDAAVIADLMSQGKFLFYEYTSMPLRDLRALLSLKRRLKKQEHSHKVRIRNNLLAQYFPELDRYYRNLGKEGLAIVRWCLDPSVIVGLEYDEFTRRVAPNGRGGIPQQERLRAVWKKAIESIGCMVGESLDVEAKLMVEGLQYTRNAIRYVEGKIEEICLDLPEYGHILSIPGFGPDISSKVVGAIGYPLRFDNGRQVLKMAGMDLSANRSGKNSDNVTPKLSKSGKADLRYALYQAAMIASFKNMHFIRYYTEKLRGREKEKGIKTKMRVKLAAKLLIIAWTLMKKQEYFDPEYLRIE
ncbi:IS110 family transposase [Deltaproteobacteria bacterium]|nr:IS110 family transposase [Deltaproteobacteria bacterium]